MFVVESGTMARGNLVAAGCIRLDGWLEGEIVCSRLEIGTDGYLLGNATARELYVEGQIVGAVTAGSVHLMQGAFVEGEVRHSKLSVHPTATLVGRAVRAIGFQVPPELVALESKESAGRVGMDEIERGSYKELAARAAKDYPKYQAARATLLVKR